MSYRFGFNPYMTMGTTPSSGLLVYAIDGLQTNTKFHVKYIRDSITGDKQQNIAINSCVDFQTVSVTAVLNNSGGSEIASGVTYEYRYGFDPAAVFTSPMELLPVNTKVRVFYSGSLCKMQQNVGDVPNFVFNTVPVTAVLNNSGGSEIASGVTYEYRYGFDPAAVFTSPNEGFSRLTPK